jgi:hypothetical protein
MPVLPKLTILKPASRSAFAVSFPQSVSPRSHPAPPAGAPDAGGDSEEGDDELGCCEWMRLQLSWTQFTKFESGDGERLASDEAVLPVREISKVVELVGSEMHMTKSGGNHKWRCGGEK